MSSHRPDLPITDQSLTRGRLLAVAAGGALAAGPAVRVARAAAPPKRGGTLVFAVETAP